MVNKIQGNIRNQYIYKIIQFTRSTKSVFCYPLFSSLLLMVKRRTFLQIRISGSSRYYIDCQYKKSFYYTSNHFLGPLTDDANASATETNMT